MNINVLTPSVSSITTENNGANVQGDELVARSWVKYLSKDHRVSNADLNGFRNDYDVTISFSPLINHPMAGYKVMYLQNVFPKPAWPGTVEVYNLIKNKYDNFIYPSNGLKEKCGEGLVCQFAVDPDLYYPQHEDPNLGHNLCFVGNNIRDKNTSYRYLLCASEKGLVIYGNPSGWNSPLCKGKISVENEAKLYSSAKICLNAHLDEHLEYGSYNFRLFNILACKGFVISDKSAMLEQEFNHCIEFTEGNDDLLSKVDYYLNNPNETIKFREYGYNHILSKHTFQHRISDLLNWLGTQL